jgi:RNA polymerase sigma factor (sigma-70 family)
VTTDRPVLDLPRAVGIPAKLMSEEPVAQPSDIVALTTQMVRGDERAYRQFHDLYFHRLLRYMLVLTSGAEELAREALQGTFLRVVRYIKTFHSEDALWSWLTVLAKSSAIDEFRKAKRYRSLLERFFRPEPPPQLPDPEEPNADMLRRLDAHLHGLSDEERDLLNRKYFEKRSVRDIAFTLGSTEKAIESRLVRIRRRLKETILKELEHEKRH